MQITGSDSNSLRSCEVDRSIMKSVLPDIFTQRLIITKIPCELCLPPEQDQMQHGIRKASKSIHGLWYTAENAAG